MSEPRGEPLGKPHLYDRLPSHTQTSRCAHAEGHCETQIHAERSSTIIEESIMGDRLNNIHPGEVLKEEFLEPLSITAYRLSKDTGIPRGREQEP